LTNWCCRDGLKDIAALKEQYKAKIETIKRETAGSVPPKPKKPSIVDGLSPFNPPPPPESVTGGTENVNPEASKSGVKSLSSFIDIPKTLALPSKEIELIWRFRHSKSPNSLCAVIPGEAYAHIALMARRHPQFILPVPREGQGAEIHFLQWTFPHQHTATVLFTQLAEYKLRGEFATPHTTLTMHEEMLLPKGLVLAQGSVQEDKGISVEDGKWLLMCLQKFYGGQGNERSERKRLMQQFTEGDAEFQIQALLEEAERIG
jgi:ATP synthase mitochondrial F1 complex assembly factor 1